MRKIQLLIILLLTIIFLSSCISKGGTMVISDDVNPAGPGYEFSFSDWTGESTREMSLSKGESLLVEINIENGTSSLSIIGDNGFEAYEGNKLSSGRFTVTVSEEDIYKITVTGKRTTGIILVTKTP